ncbi:MAG TPA: hypothetical protein VF746_10735 [Longimicrobium sp.]|jgi:hypothetical protein
MKKLELKLDDLRVETFEVESDAAERGTVRGLWDTSGGPFGCGDNCVDFSMTDDEMTCEYSCDCVSNEIACADPTDQTGCASCEVGCTANGTC